MNIRLYMTRILKKGSGFTLLEVMIALVILSIGMLGLTALQVIAMRSNAFSSEMTYATMLAENRLEAFRNMDYDSVSSGSENIAADAKTKGIAYFLQWAVTDDTPATDMKRIVLAVTWTGSVAGQSSAQHSATFTAVISRRK